MIISIILIINLVYTQKEYSNTKPVCIVGGGISGITVALNLKSKNVPFILYEKSNNLNNGIGKIYTTTTSTFNNNNNYSNYNRNRNYNYKYNNNYIYSKNN